jgi:glycosyltransferase involved in cell wall biosynthesis
MSAVAILPAHNEAPRIAPIIQSVWASGAVARTLVVDDGSTDGTADIARVQGAGVLRLPQNVGKGQAMRRGLRVTWEPIVLFLDADLTGLTPGHIERLVRPIASGECVMTVGLRDYGLVWNQMQQALPRISGERAVLRHVLERVPAQFWDGFRVEVGINAVAKRIGPVCDVPLWGVSMAPKWTKGNPAKGLLDAIRMSREVLIALGEAQRL